MTITNHLLAGALIGLTVGHPAMALALAFVSHFVMDALPHFGYPGNKGYSEVLHYKLSYVVAAGTVVTFVAALGFLVFRGEWLAVAAGLVAASPDAVGIYNWLAYEKQGRSAGGVVRLFHVRFHRAIQWCERPWGIFVEVAVTILLCWTIWRLI